MNYSFVYTALINRARFRNSNKVEGEWHHAIPVCMGGNNIKCRGIGDYHGNVVKLTYREHVFAHRLLCRIYPKDQKLAYAVVMMTGRTRWTNETRKLYEADKRRAAIAHKERMKGKTFPNRKPQTREIIDQIAASNRGQKRTLEQRQRMRDAALARDKSHMQSKEYRQKISDANRGKKHGPMPEETKKLQREQRLGKPRGGLTNAGRVWITNGAQNKLVLATEIDSHDGFYKGRTLNGSKVVHS